jgi:hypothetical protein
VPNINALVSQNAYVGMSTEGGQLFTVYGVMNLVTITAPSITIGARPCTNVTFNRTADANANQPDNSPLASWWISCLTPPGVGQNLPIIIESGGLESRASTGSFVFSYAFPKITGLVVAAPSGRLLASGSTQIDRVPTLGANVTLFGTDFGTPDLATGLLSLDPGSDFTQELEIFEQSSRYITTWIPTGDGTDHSIQYAIISPNIGNPSTLNFSYMLPTLMGLAPNHGPTTGGISLTIVRQC